jgi:hypothetical protein
MMGLDAADTARGFGFSPCPYCDPQSMFWMNDPVVGRADLILVELHAGM